MLYLFFFFKQPNFCYHFEDKVANILVAFFEDFTNYYRTQTTFQLFYFSTPVIFSKTLFLKIIKPKPYLLGLF